MFGQSPLKAPCLVFPDWTLSPVSLAVTWFLQWLPGRGHLHTPLVAHKCLSKLGRPQGPPTFNSASRVTPALTWLLETGTNQTYVSCPVRQPAAEAAFTWGCQGGQSPWPHGFLCFLPWSDLDLLLQQWQRPTPSNERNWASLPGWSGLLACPFPRP